MDMHVETRVPNERRKAPFTGKKFGHLPTHAPNRPKPLLISSPSRRLRTCKYVLSLDNIQHNSMHSKQW